MYIAFHIICEILLLIRFLKSGFLRRSISLKNSEDQIYFDNKAKFYIVYLSDVESYRQNFNYYTLS